MKSAIPFRVLRDFLSCPIKHDGFFLIAANASPASGQLHVNGAASKEEEINAMMMGTNANCEIITETWLRPGQALNYPWKTQRTDDLLQPGRPAGGVAMAILLPQNMGAKLVQRYEQDELNALWVRIPNSFDTVAVYIRPDAEREAFRCLMEDVRRRATYPFVMAGDFNARHKVWCTKNNPNR